MSRGKMDDDRLFDPNNYMREKLRSLVYSCSRNNYPSLFLLFLTFSSLFPQGTVVALRTQPVAPLVTILTRHPHSVPQLHTRCTLPYTFTHRLKTVN